MSQAKAGGVVFALTLTNSLPCCHLVLPPAATFLSPAKERWERSAARNQWFLDLFVWAAYGEAGNVFSYANWSFPLSAAKSGIDFPLTTSVAPADSRALFAPANRGAASKPPRLIRHRRRFGAFHVRAGKHFSERSECMRRSEKAQKIPEGIAFGNF